MEKRRQIENICRGKAVRIFSARPDLNTVTFVETFRNCGSRHCSRCRNKKLRPHGPYWNLNYFDDRGRPRSLYVGRLLPEIQRLYDKVLFADVLEFYREREEQTAAAARYKTRISHMKEEIEKLQEELRHARRPVARTASGKADKFYRQLAVKYHPDRHTGKTFEPEEVMKDLNQLVQLLRFGGGAA